MLVILLCRPTFPSGIIYFLPGNSLCHVTLCESASSSSLHFIISEKSVWAGWVHRWQSASAHGRVSISARAQSVGVSLINASLSVPIPPALPLSEKAMKKMPLGELRRNRLRLEIAEKLQ